jgi:hypothetical protein
MKKEPTKLKIGTPKLGGGNRRKARLQVGAPVTLAGRLRKRYRVLAPAMGTKRIASDALDAAVQSVAR